jgi:hypothetical protein
MVRKVMSFLKSWISCSAISMEACSVRMLLSFCDFDLRSDLKVVLPAESLPSSFSSSFFFCSVVS